MNNSKNINFSIVMSVYNEEKDIEKCIQSVLNQTYKHFEFIIIDDCSTDKTLKIIEHFAKITNRIKVIKNKENLGLVKSLNKGIFAAKYDWIARIDGDDYWVPQKLVLQNKMLNIDTKIGLLGGDVLMVNEKNEKILFKLPQTDSEIRKSFANGAKIPFIHSTMVFRKNLYNASISFNEDIELFSRLIEKYKAANIPEVLCLVKLQKNSFSYINNGITCVIEYLVYKQMINRYKGKNEHLNNIIDKDFVKKLMIRTRNNIVFSKLFTTGINFTNYSIFQTGIKKKIIKNISRIIRYFAYFLAPNIGIYRLKLFYLVFRYNKKIYQYLMELRETKINKL